jgi:hypothetical protein
VAEFEKVKKRPSTPTEEMVGASGGQKIEIVVNAAGNKAFQKMLMTGGITGFSAANSSRTTKFLGEGGS